MRERWAEVFAEQAKAYWTPARTQQLTGGKKLEILPGEAPVLLRALGLLHRDASMPPAQVRKYMQINHIVATLRPAFRELRERFAQVHLLDAGCGRSYLTMLLAWCFVHRYRHPIQILGVDRNIELIAECRRRTELSGLSDVLQFAAADLAAINIKDLWRQSFAEDDVHIHALVSLHACDTATDDAITLGISQGCEFIAVAPCCQAELAAKWSKLAEQNQSGIFAPIWAIPHLRREIAANITDTFRTLLLRSAGYETTAIEFVGSEHAAKNTLIRAMRRHLHNQEALTQYLNLRKATGDVGINLEQTLRH
jgi:hypothetical protein